MLVQNIKLRFLQALVSLVALSGEISRACPAFLSAAEVLYNKSVPKRQQLFAFSGQLGNDNEISWESVALHLDPLNNEGLLAFPKDVNVWEQPLSKQDRIVFSQASFNKQPPLLSKKHWPCMASQGFELSLEKATDRKLYLFFCDRMKNEFGAKRSPVTLNQPSQTISTERYSYRYRQDNQLLFDKISHRDHLGKLEEISSDADQLIYADVKNFFTMRFDTNDVEAKIRDYRLSPLGLASRLSFFLRILFFRIDLALLPEAYYFNDAVYIPMVMHLPENATRYLNFRSGIFFTWTSAQGVSWQQYASRIPTLQRYLSAYNLKDVPRLAESFCDLDSCRFLARAQLVSGDNVELIFVLKKSLIAKGFFPFFIDDVSLAEKHWGRVSKFSGPRQGFYFETSGLDAGSHVWDFWIRFDTKEQRTSPEIGCPPSLLVRPL